MSNASLKEQLQAMASQLSDKFDKQKSKTKFTKPHKTLKPKPNWLDYVHYGLDLLKTYFPQSFKPVNQVRPLKKGIKQDLLQRLSTMESVTIDDKACMVKSLSYYVNTLAYHKNVIEGAARIDLDGNPDGIVSNEEAKYSADKHLAKLQSKKAARLPNNTTSQKEKCSEAKASEE